MTKTWYISGPMRGYKHFNFAAFREAEEYLDEYIWPERVFNPARHDAEVLGMGWEPDETQQITEAQLHSWMRKDLSEVAAADHILLLPGWEASTGARREASVARWCGLHMWSYDPSQEPGARFDYLSVEYVDAILSSPLDTPATVKDVKIEGTDLQQSAFDARVRAAEVSITEDYAKDMWPEWPEFTGEVRSVNPLTGGEKGVKPERFDLVPVEPLKQVARIYGYGAAKYADRNWENGYEWSKSFAALQRHAWAFWGGETIDPESGLPHLASVVFHAMAMMEWASTHPELDDRVIHEAESMTLAEYLKQGLS